VASAARPGAVAAGRRAAGPPVWWPARGVDNPARVDARNAVGIPAGCRVRAGFRARRRRQRFKAWTAWTARMAWTAARAAARAAGRAAGHV